MSEKQMSEQEQIIDNAWKKLKYCCKDVGYASVNLEVSIGTFKRVVKEALADERKRCLDEVEKEVSIYSASGSEKFVDGFKCYAEKVRELIAKMRKA